MEKYIEMEIIYITQFRRYYHIFTVYVTACDPQTSAAYLEFRKGPRSVVWGVGDGSPTAKSTGSMGQSPPKAAVAYFVHAF